MAVLPSDPQLLAVSPKHFAEHLSVLREQYRPLALTQLVAALHEGRVPARAVVLTFDDGYADNLYHVRPLLEAYDIPATVFVTAGHVGSHHEFWWDELDRLLLQPGVLPAELVLTIEGDTWRWKLESSAIYSEEDFQHYRDWHIERPDDPTGRQQLYRALFTLVHPLSPEERQKVVSELAEWAGVSREGRPTHRTLTQDEVARLSGDGFVEIGAHTMTHPALADLPPRNQCWEIQTSKDRLESLIGRSVTSFAYPHGSRTATTVATVKAAGFSCACTSRDDAVWRADDRYRLPRVVVRDWDGDTFSRWLRAWLRD